MQSGGRGRRKFHREKGGVQSSPSHGSSPRDFSPNLSQSLAGSSLTSLSRLDLNSQPFQSRLSTLRFSYLGASLALSPGCQTLLGHHRDGAPESQLLGNPFLHFPFISDQSKPRSVSFLWTFPCHPSHFLCLISEDWGPSTWAPPTCPSENVYCHLFSSMSPDHPLTFHTHSILRFRL